MSDSPVKKLKFKPSADKENVSQDIVPVALELKKPLPSTTDVALEKPEALKVAPTIKEDESDEPLLQENPHRFVLFPIRYNEVRVFPRVTRKVLGPLPFQLTLPSTDMANVQESPSLVLVSRRD